MRKSGAGGVPGADTTGIRFALHKQRRPNAGEATHPPAYVIVEELELRQRVCEVFSGSEMRDHSELCRAQRRVR